MRSFNIDQFHTAIAIKLKTPLTSSEFGFERGTADMQTWCDLHCDGDYLMMVKSVVFTRERDALIFKLRYG